VFVDICSVLCVYFVDSVVYLLFLAMLFTLRILVLWFIIGYS